MTLTEQFNTTLTKLQSDLAVSGLVCTFSAATYPIILTVSQDVSPEGQMGLLLEDDGGVSARDARLQIIFHDGDIIIRTDERLIITDALLTKIKGQAKKLHYLYLQAYHALDLERKTIAKLPNETASELAEFLILDDGEDGEDEE